MSNEKIISLNERKGGQIRKPFVPMTGNPECDDYADWYRHLRALGVPLDLQRMPPEKR